MNSFTTSKPSEANHLSESMLKVTLFNFEINERKAIQDTSVPFLRIKNGKEKYHYVIQEIFNHISAYFTR